MAKCQFTLSAFIARANSRRTRLSPSVSLPHLPFLRYKLTPHERAF
ncbi:hypothetical protein MX167_001372 [Campylobacter upsaliensis]|nr:hypothetical protein [Campylobacter upsaliensis]